MESTHFLIDLRDSPERPTQAVGSALVRLQDNFGNQFAANGMDHGSASHLFKSGLVAVTLKIFHFPNPVSQVVLFGSIGRVAVIFKFFRNHGDIMGYSRARFCGPYPATHAREVFPLQE